MSTDDTPTLHLLCGKIAAGKSTLARSLAEAAANVLIAEDVWLSRLYREEIRALEDYVRCSRRLRTVMGPHVVDLLAAGLSVVLDFPANTPDSRRWMREISEDAGARARLHWLDVPDAVCKARLQARNLSGVHEFAPTEADFELFTKYFVAPSADEGLAITRYPGAG